MPRKRRLEATKTTSGFDVGEEGVACGEEQIDWFRYVAEPTSRVLLVNAQYTSCGAVSPTEQAQRPMFPSVLGNLIGTYCATMTLLPWVARHVAQFDWKEVSDNRNAIDFLRAQPERIDWPILSRNPRAMDLLRANPDKISWSALSSNRNAIALLRANSSRIYWWRLCANPAAVGMLESVLTHASPNVVKIRARCSADLSVFELLPGTLDIFAPDVDAVNWFLLCANPNALAIMEANLDKIDWRTASSNSGAVSLLLRHPDKVDLKWLSYNQNPKALDLLRAADPTRLHWAFLSSNPIAMELLFQHTDFICWSTFCENPKATEFLKQHPDKICWENLSSNPGALELLKANPAKVHPNIAANPAIFEPVILPLLLSVLCT